MRLTRATSVDQFTRLRIAILLHLSCCFPMVALTHRLSKHAKSSESDVQPVSLSEFSHIWRQVV